MLQYSCWSLKRNMHMKVVCEDTCAQTRFDPTRSGSAKCYKVVFIFVLSHKQLRYGNGPPIIQRSTKMRRMGLGYEPGLLGVQMVCSTIARFLVFGVTVHATFILHHQHQPPCRRYHQHQPTILISSAPAHRSHAPDSPTNAARHETSTQYCTCHCTRVCLSLIHI